MPDTTRIDWNDPTVASYLVAMETMRPMSRRAEHTEAFTLPWFLQIEERRYARHGAWLTRLMEFDKHPGERLLALGDGLGTDWTRYAVHGSTVTIASHSHDHLGAVHRHFELRGLDSQLMHAPIARYPVENNSYDVVHLSGNLLNATHSEAMIDEIYRVLKPGGKLIAILPARRNSLYWQRYLLPWSRVYQPIDTSRADRWTPKLLNRAFTRFSEHRIYQRQLRRFELPHVWRWMLLPVLERMMGRYLILKSFKPISAAIPASCAA